MNEQERLYGLLWETGERLSLEPAAPRVARPPAENGFEGDSCRIRAGRCVLKTDWVEAIERGLPYVERAIDEQRRNLRLRREIVRIDRAKRVSPESVRFLAQHSNHITHKDTGGNLIPDKLLVVERDETFAIYENRFLFTLVSTMQTFVEQRYRGVMAQSRATTLEASMLRKMELGPAHASVALEYREPLPPLPKEEQALPGDVFETLLRLRARVNALDSSQLIVMLKGTPLVRSPIVHTNVIKKNANFQQALTLFEFLENYQNPGYEMVFDTRGIRPEALGAVQRGVDALAALQVFSMSLLAEPSPLLELERNREERSERQRLEEERREQEREELVLRRIDEAVQTAAKTWEDEVRRLEAEIARRDQKTMEMEERRGVQRQSIERYSAAALRRIKTCESQYRQSVALLEDEVQGLREELRVCERKLQAERAERELDRERERRLTRQREESFEQELKKKDRQWQRRCEKEHGENQAALQAAERTYRRELRRLEEQCGRRQGP